jgi:Mitochondrial carrier protein
MQGMYRGHGANVLRVMPEVMLKFGIHDQLKVICGSTAADQAQLPVASRIAAGSLTGVIRTALLHPLSVVRTRLTADMGPATAIPIAPPTPGAPRHYSGIVQCVQETWRRERIRGFYRGASVAAVTSVPYLAVCFTSYESLLAALPTDRDSVHQWWYPVAKMSCAASACLD